MARVKRDEEEIQATAAELPDLPPEDVIEEVKRNKLKEGVLIYKASWWTDPLTEMKEETALVHCTHCGGEVHLEKVRAAESGCWRGCYGDYTIGFIDPADNTEKRSGNVCICPSCGHGMDAVHISKIRTEYEIDCCDFMTASVVRNHYVFLGWRMVKKCDKAGNVKYELYKMDAMTVIGRSPVRFTGYTTGGYNSISFKDKWFARPNYFTDYETWHWQGTFGLRDRDTAGTELEKSGAVEFFERCWEKVPLSAYLKLWAKYPNVENLVRSGNGAFLRRVIEKCVVNCGWYVQRNVFYICKAKDFINFKKVKPHEMMNLEKDELPLASVCDLEQLDLYRTVKAAEGVRLTLEELKQARKFSIHELKNLIGVSGEKTSKILRYLEKQYKRENARPDLIKVGYLRDYWTMTRQVYNGDIPQELLWPKNLRVSHDRIMGVQESKQSKETSRNIKAFAKTMSKFNFQDEETGLFIRPIATQAELIREGRELIHCVASYATRYAKQETCIFAIRKLTAPNKPFFTLEFKNGAVAQNRGYGNCDRMAEVELFEEKWLNFIKNKEQ